MARLVLVLLLLFPWPLLAQDDVFQSVENWDSSALVLSAERLGSGDYLVDVWRNSTRHPVKISAGKVVWEPSAEYISALQSMAKSGALPQNRGTAWRDHARTPAFPLIVTRARVITPFGGLELQGDSLNVQEDLVKHAKRWLFEITKEEQSLGQMDLIVDSKASVLDLMQVLFSTYEIGYFRLNFVLGKGQDLRVFEAFSPVLLSAIPPDAAFVLGVYPLEKTIGFRLLDGGVDSTNCPAGHADLGLTFCAKDLSTLRKELEEMSALRPLIVAGIGPDVTLGRAIEILELVGGLSERPPVINLVVQ
ncbi:hypothetical protein FRD01_18580 [Microvenator marinus]|uniref:Uncharacterized protein n=1 Tax=Microvenator marinus TaxID=2600177 RepID=A0A5B8XW90_9DELT|nr:hypothetical protein [Microvenator marinus]QED29208.1 hypothetical protein FRD01_18580 [Microvenator marinus]